MGNMELIHMQGSRVILNLRGLPGHASTLTDGSSCDSESICTLDTINTEDLDYTDSILPDSFSEEAYGN
ncbi:hypothetical protein H0H81_007965 [Sphagnurus paluster]|uniref:Uncharacterized protein n=1 Tax=Sphagnurus paluster TaxID=117069 RepID=A0A9P7FQS1_9AGAR|nr:hypothetical protein H0H81_007965 [Sphagnurus paluster]